MTVSPQRRWPGQQSGLVGHCIDRRNLEQQIWTLASRLSAVTERLVNQIGRDHEEFLIAKSDCAEIRAEISRLRRIIQEHRAIHHC